MTFDIPPDRRMLLRLATLALAAGLLPTAALSLDGVSPNEGTSPKRDPRPSVDARFPADSVARGPDMDGPSLGHRRGTVIHAWLVHGAMKGLSKEMLCLLVIAAMAWAVWQRRVWRAAR